jgi:O-antigen/teichoic acid export membrane protein
VAAGLAAAARQSWANTAGGLSVVLLKELLARSAWLAIGSAIGRLAPLVVLISAGQHFDAQGYANASAAFAWIGIANSLSSSGLAVVMIQRLGASRSADAQRHLLQPFLRDSLIAASAVAVVALLFFWFGLAPLFGQALDARLIWPAALAALLWSHVNMVTATFLGAGQARIASALILTCGLMQGGAMGLSLGLFDSPGALVWGLVSGSALASAFASWRQRAVWGIPDGTQVASTAQEAPLKSAAVLWHTLASSCVLPVGFLASSLIAHGAEAQRQLALYFSLEQLYQLLVYLPSIIGQALLPLVSNHHQAVGAGAKQNQQVIARINRVALLGAIAGPLLALMLTAYPAPWTVLLGPRVAMPQDAWALRLMVVGASLSLSLSLLGGALLGRGQFVVASQINLVWAAVFVFGTWLLADHGAAGLQVARIAAGVLLIGLAAWLLHRPHLAQESAST